MATNLAQYYTGKNLALPSLAQRATQYSTYGLGTGYTGSASQNAALLSKLQGGSAPTASASSSGGGYGGGSTSGGFQAGTNDSVLNGYINQTNGYQDDYQKTIARQKAELLDPNVKGSAAYENNVISNAYQNAINQSPEYQKSMDAMNKIQDALNGSQNASAAVVPQTISASRGSMANNDQVVTQAATSNIPYAEQIAQLSANLVPAENAYASASEKVKNIAGNIVTGAQLEHEGFTSGQQKELDAIQSKINQGQSLTNAEYQSYTSLTSAQIAAAAQVKAAGISAGASIQAANINAGAALKAAALQYPGITIKKDADGNYSGESFLNAKDTGGPLSSDAIKQYLSPVLSQGPSQYAGKDAQYIGQIMSLGNMSKQAATDLYFSTRQPYESLYTPAPTPAAATPSPFASHPLYATPSPGTPSYGGSLIGR